MRTFFLRITVLVAVFALAGPLAFAEPLQASGHAWIWPGGDKVRCWGHNGICWVASCGEPGCTGVVYTNPPIPFTVDGIVQDGSGEEGGETYTDWLFITE
jgi:hypothetical protein